MRISVLTIGAIASVLSINSVFATTSTVTSKDYVDAADALKQNKIPATGTNSSTPGSTVVTYTSTAGTIGERGICNDPDEEDCNGGDLVTLYQVANFVAEGLDDAVNNMPTVTTSKMTCVDAPDCTLWSVSDQTVYGSCIGWRQSCGTSVAECSGLCCPGLVIDCSGTNCRCSRGDEVQ